MYMTYNPTQTSYIDSLVGTFSKAEGGYVPAYVDIMLRFSISDPVSKASVDPDVFTMRIWGNNETLSDQCAFHLLSMKSGTNMLGSKTYKVSDGTVKYIDITNQIEGLDSLAYECKELMSMTLDYKTDGGQWEPLYYYYYYDQEYMNYYSDEEMFSIWKETDDYYYI
jgi:hypothetical protein